MSQKKPEVQQQVLRWKQPEHSLLFNRRRSSSCSSSAGSAQAGPDQTALYTAEHVRAEIAGVVRQIEIQREGQLETIFFPVPETCAEQFDSRFVRAIPPPLISSLRSILGTTRTGVLFDDFKMVCLCA